MPTHHLKNARLPSWLDGVLLTAMGGTLLLFGWRGWTHAFIDFGRELYVPWQLSLGRVLYQDIAYFNGPISPYLNALAFDVFGVGLSTLIGLNLLILAGTSWLLYRLLHTYTDRLTALCGSALFLLVFALADLVGFGNYNFVTPYSHEMTHGTLLSLLLLLALGSALQRPSARRFLLVGSLLGTLFLIKAEFFVAAGAAVTCGLLIEQRQGRRIGPQIGWLAVGCLVVPSTAAAWLLTRAPASVALEGVLGPWPYVLLDRLTELVFYRKGMGTDAPSESLRHLLIWLALYGLLFAPVWLVARRIANDRPHRSSIAAGLALWVGAVLMVVAPRFGLSDLPRPLPVLLAAAVLIGIWPLLRRAPGEEGFDWRAAATVTRWVFAWALLAKMALNTRFHNYGFALAMPATMVLIELLLYWIPRRIDRQGGYGPAFRAAGLVFVVLVAVAFTWPSILVYEQKRTWVGSGADRFRVQQRYALAATLLERLPRHLSAGDTLLVLPEGVMLNYQLRVESPTPYVNFMPPEMIMYGESRIIAALESAPPDLIVLLKRRTIEYGFETIGDGYGEDLMRWVAERYPIIETIEEPGMFGKNFGKAFVLRHAP